MSAKNKTESKKLSEDIRDLRRQYSDKPLLLKNISENPYKQFSKWFDEVLKCDFLEPNAVALSTVSPDGKPSSRMVLLKDFDENGFVFFTNYKSRKANEIEANPYASLLFWWDKLERQVRIEGLIEKIPESESDEYFSSRPYKSRIGAWASPQSRVIGSRSEIVRNFMKYMLKYKTNPPRPPHWGGYRLIPYEFE
ncbi:MAG: pyridoxamine 5'-phosphate oxidase, partial [Ignavibacteria bacterium]|nr:pyridoxamine 5'-phosphate oxidase [Ignavibacteria bacterium]